MCWGEGHGVRQRGGARWRVMEERKGGREVFCVDGYLFEPVITRFKGLDCVLWVYK